jgi:hypothetical protein
MRRMSRPSNLHLAFAQFHISFDDAVGRGCAALMRPVRVSADARNFVLGETQTRFVAWGLNLQRALKSADRSNRQTQGSPYFL